MTHALADIIAQAFWALIQRFLSNVRKARTALRCTQNRKHNVFNVQKARHVRCLGLLKRRKTVQLATFVRLAPSCQPTLLALPERTRKQPTWPQRPNARYAQVGLCVGWAPIKSASLFCLAEPVITVRLAVLDRKNFGAQQEHLRSRTTLLM